MGKTICPSSLRRLTTDTPFFFKDDKPNDTWERMQPERVSLHAEENPSDGMNRDIRKMKIAGKSSPV